MEKIAAFPPSTQDSGTGILIPSLPMTGRQSPANPAPCRENPQKHTRRQIDNHNKRFLLWFS